MTHDQEQPDSQPGYAASGPKNTSTPDDHVAQLSGHWQVEHKKRAKEIESELRKDCPQAAVNEQLLAALAAHDVALSETLGKTEVQLAQRALALVDNPQHVLALAKALKIVVACREGAARRAQELLVTAGVLRGQRKLAEVPHLRRVA